jgi:putative salt-induced outer membrane protein YdiY
VRSKRALPLSIAVFLVAAAAAAADPQLPVSQQTQSKATSGSTDVASDKTVVADKPADNKDTTELQVQAGGISAEGNARSLAMTGGSKFRLRRDDNQFRSAIAGNYAATSAPSPASRSYDSTVQNVQGMLRYDRFLADWMLFLQLQARNDRFAGYDARLQLDPGVGYAFINEKTTQLTGEVGYDLMYQKNRRDARYLLNADKVPILDASGRLQLDPNKPDTFTIHSARAALAFEYALNESSKLTSNLEYLQGVNDTTFYRVNFDAAITAKFGKALSFSFGESIRFDNSAAQLAKAKTDYLTSANLVYTLL